MTIHSLESGAAPVPVALKGQRPRLDHLDSLRALAAVYVMLHHAWLTGQWRTGNTWAHWLGYGHYAVTLFIVLSGYCLMLPVVRGDGTLQGSFWDYLKRRARRILPPYYAAIALSLALTVLLIGKPTGTMWDAALPAGPAAVISHALLLHDVIPTHYYKINYVFWSIAVEAQIYFLFPALLFFWRRWGGGITTFAAIVLGFAGSRLAHGTFLAGATPHFLGLFTLGMLGAAIAHSSLESWENLRNRLPWMGLGLGTGGVFLALLEGLGESRQLYASRLELLLALATVGLLVGLARSEGWLSRILKWKPLVALGGFSYSLYLLHAPLQQVVLQHLLWPLGIHGPAAVLALILVGSPLIIAISFGFHLVAERPFMVRTSQRASRPGEPVGGRGRRPVPAVRSIVLGP